MMTLFRISNKSLNLVAVLTHTREGENNQGIMDQVEDEADQNV